MKFLKTFENFYLPQDMETDEEDYLRHRKTLNTVNPDDDDDYCEPCEDDDEPELRIPSDMPPYKTKYRYSDDDQTTLSRYNTEDEFEDDEDEFEDDEDEFEDHEDEFGKEPKMPHIMRFESKKSKPVSYKKSGLKNPEKADRNKNNKIEGWEKAVAKKIEDSMDKKNNKGLSAAQKKLAKKK